MPKKPSGSSNFKALLERVKADRSNFIGAGTPEEAIQQLERFVQIKLPESYVLFLREFDGGEFGFGRMHCITENGAGFWDFRQELLSFFARIPLMATRWVVPFGSSYAGDTYCFNFKDVSGGEPSIVEFDHEGPDDQELIPRAKNLEEWIQKFYDDMDNDSPSAELYIASEHDLSEVCSNATIALNPADPHDFAVRAYFDRAPQNKYALVFTVPLKALRSSDLKKGHKLDGNATQLKDLAVMIEQATEKTNSPIQLLAYSNLEMSMAPEHKITLGKMPIFGGTTELTAGDIFEFEPERKFEAVPRAYLNNHVPKPKPLDLLLCNFCGRAQDEVKRLIAGPGLYICDECVELCADIINADSEPVA